MKVLKSHFVFSKNQQKGIFLLLMLIAAFQSVYFFIDFSSEEIQVNQRELANFKNVIDSLRLEKLQEPKLKPFNPNYIDDYKGSILGMSTQEINRLFTFRKQNQWVNSKEEFQQVTKISDSLLSAISLYFKFPDWVNAPDAKKTGIYSNINHPKSYSEKQDLNTASAIELQEVNGVGKVLSERIIKYRNTFVGGFIANVQLEDVYGLSPETIQNITNQFTVKTPRIIERIDLNTATINQLVTIPHIDYDLAYEIVEQRSLRDGYNAIGELLKVKDFPSNKIKIIQLYLQLEKKIDE